jgi:hypothetical protein
VTIPRSRIARLRRIAFWHRLLKGTRGAVFAEVVVMLPFFIILWASIIYVHKYYSSRITLGAQAKSCAWQYSNGGCRSTPAGCESLTVHAGADFSSDDLPGGGSFQQFANDPFVRPIIQLVLGSNSYVTGNGNVVRPAQLGSGNTPITSRNVVMCNEVPTSPQELARRAFCNLTHLCH